MIFQGSPDPLSPFLDQRSVGPDPAAVHLVITVYQSTNLQQDLHRLEKYLNLEGFLEKSLKIKYASKILENHTFKALKSP